MKVIKRIIRKLDWFFTIDLPMFFIGLSVPWRYILIALGVILAPVILPLLLIHPALIFISIMSALSSNKTYELLYPVEEIAVIDIIEVTYDVGLYSYPIDDIATYLDANTSIVTELDNSRIEACMDDLLDLSASQWWNDPSPYIEHGTMRITYRNGSREWICATGTFYYDSCEDDSSMTWYYFDRDEFLSYLQDYGYQRPR